MDLTTVLFIEGRKGERSKGEEEEKGERKKEEGERRKGERRREGRRRERKGEKEEGGKGGEKERKYKFLLLFGEFSTGLVIENPKFSFMPVLLVKATFLHCSSRM